MRKRAAWRVEQLEAREVPSASPGFFAAGTDAGGPSTATFYTPDGTARFSVQPFGPAFGGGVRVAVGDVDGDGTPDLITAAGPGGASVVKSFSGADGAELGGFLAFESSFTGGVNVAAGDLDQDGVDEIILSPDAGGGPRVRIVSGADGAEVLADFMGLEDPAFRGGVRVAVGDINGDQAPDLVVGAGAGGGSRVAVYSGAGFPADASRPTRLVNDFLVFDSRLRDGVNLAAGDVNGDGFVDLVFGAGAGGSPRVVVADGKAFLAAGGLGDTNLLNAFAFDQSSRTGARVAAGDLDGDGVAEVLVGPGPGVGGVVRRYSLNGTVTSTDLVTPFNGSLNGLFVAVQSQPTARKSNPTVNTPPQISDTSDPAAVTAGTAVGPIGFTVSDLETTSTRLVVTASSNNPAVVPNSGISLGGSRTNRTVTLTPAAGATGTATITLTVTDAGGLTATDTFSVTFTTPGSPPPPPPPPPSGNTAPRISNIAGQSVPQGGNTGAVPFTVSDNETAPSGLSVSSATSNPTLVSLAGITITGAGQDRTVTVTPAAGQSGTATITLTVTDAGGLSATDTFTVTVAPPSPPAPSTPTDPRVLLTSAELADLRQAAAANTPQWQAFKTRLDQNLGTLIIGGYQGSQLSWIEDYALGYQVLKLSDPVTAAKYADKAIAVLKSAMRDYQVGGIEARQFLARGDGTTVNYALPNADVLPSTVQVYVVPVITVPVVRGAAGTSDAIGYYATFLKASSTSDGPADYAEGVDWQRNHLLLNNQFDWSLPGNEPAPGSTYYVTLSGSFGYAATGYSLSGHTITLPVAPRADQAVYVQYVYGTPSADGSTLAYQQTSAGDGGFTSIFKDSSYTSRYLGKYTAIGYDWLQDYIGFSPALKAEAADLLVRWSDYTRDSGYFHGYPASNYEAGAYVSRMFTALALSGGRDPNGNRLLGEMQAYRQNVLLPVLQNPDASLKGGFWAEGWSYGALATQNVLLAGLAYEAAGLGAAGAERVWASEVIRHLVSAQPTPTTVYDGGDFFAFPAPLPGKELFYVLAAATTDAAARSYANYVIQNNPGAQSADATDLLFRDPGAATSFWSDLPLHHRAEGSGLVIARADWDYDSTFVSYQLGNLLGADHQSFIPGQLQLQRGGDALLINANTYGVNQAAQRKSTYGNMVLIDDNGDGLQNYRWSMGVWYGNPGVVTTAYEATDGYVYAAGDYRAAYSLNTNPGGGGPATELTRQVVYLRPDLVVVHDRAGTVKDSYPKQLQWHFVTAPTVTGNSWVAAAGASKLFGQTLSTQALTTTVQSVQVGNKTVGQVTTRNSSPSEKVRYTTVLETAASSVTSMVSTQQVVSSDGRMEGVQMGGNVVLFGTDGAVVPAGGAVTYSVTGSVGLDHLLTDLQPGRVYQLEVNGAATGSVTASDQGTLAFTTSATGAVTVRLS